MDLEVEQGPRHSLVIRPLRAVMGPFVTRALAAVLDSSAIGAEVILDLSPAQAASPGSLDVLRGAMRRATDRGVAVSVHIGPEGVGVVHPDQLAPETTAPTAAASAPAAPKSAARGNRRR